jgi:predicted transglutaminase-like cysteine proteinase
MARYLASSLLAAFGLFGLAEQAGAVAIGRMLANFQATEATQLSAVVRLIEPTSCTLAARSAVPRMETVALAPSQAPILGGLSKVSALLGGAGSALDRIRMDQAAQAASATLLAGQADSRGGVAGAGLAPGAAPLTTTPAASFAPGMDCNRLALPRTSGVPFQPGRSVLAGGSEDFLQTRRLAVSRTAFDQQWDRVSQQGLSAQALRREAGLGGIVSGRATLDTVATVNAWANRRIRFVEDAKLFRQADYWAPAQTALRLGAGDCEDIAIAKLQALAAVGVPRSDMFLTIARDLARHADHALLVVRMDGRFWLLDNSTDRVLDAAESYDYQPVLSFSQNRKWLHGAVLASR